MSNLDNIHIDNSIFYKEVYLGEVDKDTGFYKDKKDITKEFLQVMFRYLENHEEVRIFKNSKGEMCSMTIDNKDLISERLENKINKLKEEEKYHREELKNLIKEEENLKDKFTNEVLEKIQEVIDEAFID